MKVNSIYQVYQEPDIFLSIGYKNWVKFAKQHHRKGYLLAHPMWYFSWTSLVTYWKLKIKLNQENFHLIILSNSKEEHKFAQLFGFESYLINQNIQVCEHQFHTLDNVEKEYDAIYTAAAKKYKRLYLAEKVKNLFVITYFWPDIRDKNGQWDLHAFEPRVSHAGFNRDRISLTEVNSLLNKSRCGLALSKKEGAMFASMEYLLAGLPVVSTKSKGGRDFFFDERFVEIVDDNTRSVSKGVQKIIQKKIDPEIIRSETLQKVNKQRKKFYQLIKK